MFTIAGIFRAPTAGAPMESLEQGMLVAGRGLEGDRYFDQQGTYSVLPKEPGRQLTLVCADEVDRALDNAHKPSFSMGDLRRNIVLQRSKSTASSSGHLTAAQPLALLQESIGAVLALGDTVRVLIHRPCVPCMYNERKNGLPDMMELLWEAAGVNVQVLVGGRIDVGGPVRVVTNDYDPPSLPPINDGNKPNWFYVRPSQRTLSMVKEGIEQRRQSKAKLLQSDPVGVRRAEDSFAAVGLTFFPPDK